MLKSVLSLLLSKFYSKKESEAVGHQAMPVDHDKATNLSLTIGAEGSYVSPADGYLAAMVEPGGNMNFWGQVLPMSSFPVQNVQGKLFIPMAKGMQVKYFINGTVSFSRFFRTIGGGYKRLVNLFCKEVQYA